MSTTPKDKKPQSIPEHFDKLYQTLIPEASEDQPGLMFNHIVNISKCGMFVLCFTLMILYNNFSFPSLLITLFHGSYGVIWVFKDVVFGDKSFVFKTNYLGVLVTSLALVFYASMAFVIISNPEYKLISVDRFFTAGFCYVFGVILMIASDAQKTFTLRIKKGLISNGVNAWTRNPNYLGEITLYLGFGILAQHMFCYFYLVTVWLTLFWSRMDMKEKSLAKKEGWKVYSQNSYMLLPKLFSSHAVNHVVYLGFICIIGYLYFSGGLLNRLIESRGGNYMVGW
jgi:protein-S-isoprenylcysteine O-methyltransferase Ste14